MWVSAIPAHRMTVCDSGEYQGVGSIGHEGETSEGAQSAIYGASATEDCKTVSTSNAGIANVRKTTRATVRSLCQSIARWNRTRSGSGSGIYTNGKTSG